MARRKPDRSDGISLLYKDICVVKHCWQYLVCRHCVLGFWSFGRIAEIFPPVVPPSWAKVSTGKAMDWTPQHAESVRVVVGVTANMGDSSLLPPPSFSLYVKEGMQIPKKWDRRVEGPRE